MLKALAERYSHITEMGVRYGVSTRAFLAGKPEKMVSYDIRCQIDVQAFVAMAPETLFVFVEGDSLEVTIADTDVLFIDTLHTADQLYTELRRHSSQVRSHIVLHDTTTFGTYGEDGREGLNYAITKFLSRHVEWRLSNYYSKNNGLSILSR